MDRWCIHFTVDFAAVQAVDTGFSDREIRDALLGAAATVAARAQRNWRANQRRLIAAFDAMADELVAVAAEVLDQRRALKAAVVEAGEGGN